MTTRLALLLTALVAVSACSPEDKKLSVAPEAPKNLPQVDVSRFPERTPELNRHLLSQLSQARLMLERAYNEEVEARINSPINSPIRLGGCRTIRKVGPPRDRNYPITVESFRVLQDCRDISKPQTWGEIKGAELFDVVWSQPYPSETDAVAVPGYPTFIRMVPKGQIITLQLHTPERPAADNVVRIVPRGELSIAFAGEDATHIEYRVSSDITNDFDYQVQGVRRIGGVRMRLLDVEMKLSKETKKVTSIENATLMLQVTDRAQSEVGPGIAEVDEDESESGVVAKIELDLDGSMKLTSDSCALGNGEFDSRKTVSGVAERATIMTSEGKLDFKGGGVERSLDHRVCTPDGKRPVFHQEYESIYF